MRFFRFIWNVLNNLRRLVQLLFLLVIVVVIVAGFSEEGVTVPDSVALVIAPAGALVDQLEGDPFDRAMAEVQGAQVAQTLVHDVVESLELAAEDDRIQAVMLELDGLGGGGLAKLQSIGRAIELVREAGKPVIAVGDGFTQEQYYLAAHADEIYMHDLGALLIDGYEYYRMFLRDALEKLRIDVNVFRVGKYKSFVEPYTRNDMSDEDRVAGERWVGALWSAYTRDVEAARGLDQGAIDAYANDFIKWLELAGGDAAQAALNAGLVDFLGDRSLYVDRVIEIVGPDEADDDWYNGIGMAAYLKAMRAERAQKLTTANIGVLVAVGEIVDGEAPRGTIGGDTLAALVAQAADDDTIDALVLRVDSPGGSMFASEVVFAELQRLKLTGKPFVVSMSATAASGGYYIAMPADEIWAGETTITGSIGVGAIVPTFQRTLNSLGVNVDGFGTTELSGQFRGDRELGEDARALLQLTVEDAYGVFLDKVSLSRALSIERVRNVARGRVWIGSDALELGLVDRLGDLGDAVESAADLAGLEDGEYGVKFIETPLTFRERVAFRLATRVSALTGNNSWSLSMRTPKWMRFAIRSLEREFDWLSKLNDPRGLYLHCFCQLP
jgi:protease-4